MKIRELLLWIVLVVLAVFIWDFASAPARGAHQVILSELMARVDAGSVTKVAIEDRQIIATTKANETLVTEAPADLGGVLPKLIERHVQVEILSGGASRNPTVRVISFYTSTVLPWFTLIMVIAAFGRLRALERKLDPPRDGAPDQIDR
jgi:ATP-dependent Zn protease